MNDSDEDHDAERRLNQRMIAAGGTYPPKANLLAPAALYLTAILEYVLSNMPITLLLTTLISEITDIYAGVYLRTTSGLLRY